MYQDNIFKLIKVHKKVLNKPFKVFLEVKYTFTYKHSEKSQLLYPEARIKLYTKIET